MLAFDIVLSGLILGGTYALIAIGLTLQYGVARIMNLAYGELLVAAAFGAYWLYTANAVSPIAGLVVIVPAAFAINWLIYTLLLTPLVRRAKSRDALEADSILATFGMLFVVQGTLLVLFGGQYYSDRYLQSAVVILGDRVEANKLVTAAFAIVVSVGLYLGLTHTRAGTAVRAVAVAPGSARLVGIDVQRTSAFAFALGGALSAAGGVLVSMSLLFSASSGVLFTMKALIVVIMGGAGNLLGALVAGLILGTAEIAVARLIDPGLTIAINFVLFLAVLLVRPAGLFGRPAAMNAAALWQVPAAFLAVALLAAVPFGVNDYQLGLAINLAEYTVLATAWALFSGPTRYVSLATAAFFGIGAYAMAVLWERVPEPAVIAIAAAIGIAVALLVGMSTLRLRGVYFVIFTFGLGELIHQLVSWYETNYTGTVGRYIYLDITQAQIFWQLLGLGVLVFLVGWLIRRSRLGLALRVIGDDETVARHVAINTTTAKLVLFAVSAGFISATGAVMAPRWTYIDPNIAFNALVSFQVVIMALLGGAGRLHGPILGVVPLVLVAEFLSANFPSSFLIILGVVFLVIVYFLPDGVAGLVDRWRAGALRLPASRVAAVPFAGGRLLELDNVRKTFGGLVAVDDISLAIDTGEILGLIGPNGSGKTTALNLISGALRSDGGEIRFKGRPINALPAHQIARLGIARTFQLVRVLESMSCLDNVVAGLAFRPDSLWGDAARERAIALLDRVGLAARANVPAGQLTYLDQKRLELARALALEPELLLLDEWLAGLNPRELGIGIDLVQSLRQDGLTIVLVEHVMDAIRSLCDRCVVMNAGRKIADGPPAAVLADEAVITAYLGAAAHA